MKALVTCPGGLGPVLLAGPAVRAVATRATRVTLLCGARGAPAAGLLPHVDDVVVWDGLGTGETPGTSGAPEEGAGPPAAGTDTGSVLRRLRDDGYDVALVLAPGGRDPLPTARLLRAAGVRRVGAGGPDPAQPVEHDGDLLDVRRRCPPGRHEAEEALDAAAALGFSLRPGDDGRLRVLPAPDTAPLTGNGPYVVVHPGSGWPAHAWDPGRCAETVALLADAGHRVVVTGGPGEAALTRRVSGDTAVDLGGRTSPRVLAGVLRCADVLVAGGTGPAQLAAAVGTPVVSLFPPAVPAGRRAPYRVPAVLLGDPGGRDADPGARDRPVPGRARPDEVTPQDAVRAVRELLQAGP
ncbi:glycosyltransferase family 9 protein [Streptomyces sp. NPDC051041]|uniref:glycosyltransferase family 9 protein n=1 Tax=Streptomyces sp. NPDC051041 TaxID=3365640 RepID=UPI0037B97A1E